MNKPYSQACENNKVFIATQLQKYFASVSKVLEIGSGTGQHAVYFASQLPHLTWQTSDQPHYHVGINLWIDEFLQHNICRPIALTITPEYEQQYVNHNKPLAVLEEQSFDGVFSANTAHIMQPDEVAAMMALVGKLLPKNGVFCQYGPFQVNGEFTSESNRMFHQQLVAGGYGGYQDINQLQLWADQLTLHKVVEMPANNLLLVWQANG